MCGIKKIFLCLMICLCSLVGCGKTSDKGNDTAINQQQDANDENNDTKVSFSTKDTGMGLYDIKIDNEFKALSKIQKTICEYHNYDNAHRVNWNNYEQLQRYPDIYAGAKLSISGYVKSVIKSNSESYEILLQISDSLGTEIEQLAYITGNQTERRIVKGDYVTIYGIYKDIINYEENGEIYNIPKINGVDGLEIMSLTQVKEIANYVFGEKASVEFLSLDYYDVYAIELYDTSAKHKSFNVDPYNGEIYLSVEYNENSGDTIRAYEFEFMPDCKHYFIITSDVASNRVTIEYFDRNWNKLWARSFENTTEFSYDYTEKNIYFTTNNKLYIINTSSGEDSLAPIIVGNIDTVKKLKNGIILFPCEFNDEIIFLDLNGEVKWTTEIRSNTAALSVCVSSMQSMGDTILVNTFTPNCSIEQIRAIDCKTGEIILEEIIDPNGEL